MKVNEIITEGPMWDKVLRTAAALGHKPSKDATSFAAKQITPPTTQPTTPAASAQLPPTTVEPTVEPARPD